MMYTINRKILFLTVVGIMIMVLILSGCRRAETPEIKNDPTADITTSEMPSAIVTDPNETDHSADTADNGGKSSSDDGTAQKNSEEKDGSSDQKKSEEEDDESVQNTASSELARLYELTLENMKPLEGIELPEDSSVYSPVLASQALSMCSQGTKGMTSQFMNSSGFEVLLQANYDKDKSDPSHTCAFTLARKTIEYNGKSRELLVVAIRGTDSGEWFSNFDFASSHLDEAVYAENFLQASQDVYVRILPRLIEYPDALILVCGHSRGAACANLLGMTLDDQRSPENVFVYTFATPFTIRGEFSEADYPNIFNLINPADIITYLPLSGWGFKRIGNDIILNGDKNIAGELASDMSLLCSFAPTISDYYEKHYILEGVQGFEDGITTYDTMLALASFMTGIEGNTSKGLKITDIIDHMTKSSNAAEFYPLVHFLKLMVGNDGNMNITVFKQHMPAIYQELIE